MRTELFWLLGINQKTKEHVVDENFSEEDKTEEKLKKVRE